MSLERIHQAIPHRAPFLLVDEIVEWSENRIVCRRKLSGDEFWFQGHYPNQPIMPGVLMCEACLQSGAILLSKHVTESIDEKVPVATRMNNVKFKHIVRPGETIEIDVELNDRVADAFYMTGKVSSGGKLAARLEFACTLAPAK
jgi:3-hydroxyacyl-[acyl-carrier-protein] dehydratase